MWVWKMDGVAGFPSVENCMYEATIEIPGGLDLHAVYLLMVFLSVFEYGHEPDLGQMLGSPACDMG